ncbi:UbiA family prenyltransferase [Paenibacillus marinisediminis]
MNKLQLFMKASRVQVVPIMLIPVILGALGAYVWEGVFHPLLLLITLLGSAAAHLFSNMINDLWDYRSGVDIAAKETAGTISTNSGFLANGTMSERTFAIITWALFGFGMLCAIILSIISGWWAFVLGLLGGLIAYFYVGPPLRFGYRGKGYSEIAILLSFGVLPIAGSYYVQTSHFDYRAILLSLPIGLLTTLILFNHHFLHWQADKQSGKNTLVVVWGEERALKFSKLLLFLAYGSLVLCVVLGILPLYALIAVITVIPLYQTYGRVRTSGQAHAFLPLMKSSLQATIRCGAIMMLSLIIQGLIQ